MGLNMGAETVINEDVPMTSVAFVHIPPRATFLGKLDYDTSYGDETVRRNNQR